MKIISIVGARPQFIKLSLLSNEIRKYHEEIIIHTGQHYDIELSKIFFDDLKIPKPAINLEVGSGSHGYQTGEMLIKIEEVLINEKPDMVIVYGDTNSTLAGALAASKLHIKLVHVEAGMRNFDRQKPEEINRIITDHISDLLFPPTENAAQNLNNEGIKKNVFIVGDVTFDVLKKNIIISEDKSKVLEENKLKSKEYYTVTIHKTKNTDNSERLEKIINSLVKVDYKIILPLHPRTKKNMEEYGLMDKIQKSNVQIIKPLGYLDFLKLLNHSSKIITDSGGVQKEAYACKVPCITLRETEWVETVEDGWNIIVEIDENEILNQILNFVPNKPQSYFLGDGNAYKKIVKIINEFK